MLLAREESAASCIPSFGSSMSLLWNVMKISDSHSLTLESPIGSYARVRCVVKGSTIPLQTSQKRIDVP